jgi:hypothetical protein
MIRVGELNSPFVNSAVKNESRRMRIAARMLFSASKYVPLAIRGGYRGPCGLLAERERRSCACVTVQTPSLRTMMGFAALYPSYRKNKEL